MMRTSRISPGSAPRTIDRPGADMYAKAFAGAAAEELAVDRPGAAAIDAFLLLGPQKHAFGARIALDHALGVVIGVVGQRFDRHIVAGVDLKPRLEQLAEIAPMHGVGGRRQIVVGGAAQPGRALRRRRRHQRAARRQGRRAAARRKGAFEETAPLSVEIVEQFTPMQLELWAIVIVACAHGALLNRVRMHLAIAELGKTRWQRAEARLHRPRRRARSGTASKQSAGQRVCRGKSDFGRNSFAPWSHGDADLTARCDGLDCRLNI